MSKRTEPAWLCQGCGTTTTDSGLLSAPYPFPDGDAADEKIYGCPGCHGVELILACDEEGCDMEGTCGTPTGAGYRHTCYEHVPKEPRWRCPDCGDEPSLDPRWRWCDGVPQHHHGYPIGHVPAEHFD